MDKFDGFITPTDVAQRLYRRHRFWFNGKPIISLEGKEKEFGRLKFDFGDQIVEYRIYIHDREKILNASHFAIENMCQIISSMTD